MYMPYKKSRVEVEQLSATIQKEGFNYPTASESGGEDNTNVYMGSTDDLASTQAGSSSSHVSLV
jgi:hypothetical protein